MHHKIDAQFEFRDGKIVKHTDTFDFYGWSRQALAVPGALLGWSSWFQGVMQKKVGKRLDDFIAQHPEYQ